MGELVLAEGEPEGKAWSVERRFRVTEVFLAVLWVREIPSVVNSRLQYTTRQPDCFAKVLIAWVE